MICLNIIIKVSIKSYVRGYALITTLVGHWQDDPHKALHVSMNSTRLLILLLAFGVSFCCAVEERFYEQLVLRPNHDGTVTSSFAFTTLLKGEQPRDPRKLGQEDGRK